MSVTTGERKEALAAAVEQELGSLQARGVRIAGNAFSPVVLVKGELNADELAGESLLSGADGTALRAALSAIGWEPQDFCALATVFGTGEPGIVDGPVPGDAVPAELFREALEALDPEAIVLLDDAAADAMREATRTPLRLSRTLTRLCSSPGWWLRCWDGACLRSTASRRHSRSLVKSSACGHISSSSLPWEPPINYEPWRLLVIFNCLVSCLVSKGGQWDTSPNGS